MRNMDKEIEKLHKRFEEEVKNLYEKFKKFLEARIKDSVELKEKSGLVNTDHRQRYSMGADFSLSTKNSKKYKCGFTLFFHSDCRIAIHFKKPGMSKYTRAFKSSAIVSVKEFKSHWNEIAKFCVSGKIPTFIAK